MNTLRLKSVNTDVALEFSDVEGDDFRVSVVAHDHSATRMASSYTDRAGIARLFAEAANEWKDRTRPKVWESLEGELRIELHVDRRGHATVVVRVGSDRGQLDEWQLYAELGLEFGQLERIAREANYLWCGGD